MAWWLIPSHSGTEWFPLALSQWAEPQGVYCMLIIDPVDEALCTGDWKRDVLDDVVFCHAALMRAVVEDLGI